MVLTDITNENFEKEILNSDVPIILDFWAPWCGPCKMAAPVLEKLSEYYSEKVKICRLNVDEESQIAGAYGIRSIPTLNIYKENEVVKQIVGVTSNYESTLRDVIDDILKTG